MSAFRSIRTSAPASAPVATVWRSFPGSCKPRRKVTTQQRRDTFGHVTVVDPLREPVVGSPPADVEIVRGCLVTRRRASTEVLVARIGSPALPLGRIPVRPRQACATLPRRAPRMTSGDGWVRQRGSTSRGRAGVPAGGQWPCWRPARRRRGWCSRGRRTASRRRGRNRAGQRAALGVELDGGAVAVAGVPGAAVAARGSRAYGIGGDVAFAAA